MATAVETKGWTRDQMAARVKRLILGAPYDKKIEFRTVRERQAA